jgi:hypothetical protein
MKRKNNFLDCLQEVINENGPQRNVKSTSLKFVLGDYDTVITDADTKNFLSLNHITLYSSAPYKYEQNLAERYVCSIKDGLRTIISYNNAPKYYWCYVIEYYCYTFNCMPRYDSNKSRIENFSGNKPDVSYFVPFYAKGVTHITREQ